MTERKKSTIPFVGLHAHSVCSVFDGLGFPNEHMDFAYSNGCDALALTDHGNMNGLPYQVLHAKKMRDAGKEFKPIFGVEAYFHPDLKQWHKDKEAIEQERKAAKGRTKKEDDETSGVTIEDEEATKKGIKNVLNKRRHLILLAQNQTGLNNIFQLISKSYTEECYYRFPRVDYAMLAEHSEGVIAASACLGGVYAGDMWENQEQGDEAVLAAMRETTRRMQEVFGDRWYGELQWNKFPEQHKLNNYVIQVADEMGVKLISTADSHYPTPDAWRSRIIYKRLGWLGKKSDAKEMPADIAEVGYELYPKNGDDMWASYKQYSEQAGFTYDDKLVEDSIRRTHEIAHERIEDFLPDTEVRLPSFVIPEGKTADEALKDLAEVGLKKVFHIKNKKKNVHRISKVYTERLERELDVIGKLKFSQYFLTMSAISDKANEFQLTGPGRGSGAGSLVAYALGITQVDPIKYDLQFERFLRLDATDYPDIDYDVSDPMTLKEMFIDEWGEDKVAPISNWNTLQLKSLVKDISKFYDIPFKEVNAVTSKMIYEATPLAKAEHGITAGVYVPTFEEVMKYSVTLQDFLRKYPHVETHVNALYGSIRSASRHAGGVVISENLDKWMPLINSKGVRQTPWSEGQNVRHLEPMGFIKFDILGLATLAMMETAITHILKRHKGIKEPTFDDIKQFYDENLHPDIIDFDDQEIYKNVFHKGKWAGIFQFTESGAQKFCVRAKPNSIVDIAAITSIFRPGPLSAKVDRDYVAAKNNPESVEYIHPLAREVTEETYGFLIFQEQIASLSHKLGKDISLNDGNIIRKVLTKKGTGKADKVLAEMEPKFIEGCLEKGLSREDAQRQWDLFDFFSGYGFNKSHAVSYSIISYQCAWLLNYYAPEWVAAFLDKEPESRKEKAINIAKSLGFKIKGVDVNSSGSVWEISKDGKTMIQPLSSIKGVGDAAIAEIVNHRPFNSIEEFLFHERISYSKLNKKNLDVLCRSGALSNLMDERFSGSKHFWSAVAVERPRKEKDLEQNIALYSPEGDFTQEEQIINLIDLTGVYPVGMIVSDDIRRRLDEHFIPPLAEFEPELEMAWFIPKDITIKKTKNGKEYAIIDAIDDTNTVTRIKCWGYKRDRDIVHLNRPYMAKLDYDEQWGFSSRSIRHNFRMLG